MIYLDAAATTLQKPPGVSLASARAIRTCTSPGRGGHPPAMAAARVAYDCRAAAGELMGVGEPERVVFTMNATHGLNIAICSLVKPGDTVVVSGWEHNAVTRPLHALGANLKVAAGPLFDQEAALTAFDRALTREVACAVCTQCSNVFGMILPIPKIAALCRERGIPLIVDASQGAGCLPIDADGWGAAFVAMPGHKGLYGPQGTGLLLCGKDVTAVPVLEGGTGSDSINQEMPEFLPDRLEAGTHNIAGIAGLLEGLRFVSAKGPQTILAHERRLLARAGNALSQLPGVEVFYDPTGANQGGVLSFRLARTDCETAAEWLGTRGVAVRAGMHCAPLAHRTQGTLDTGTVRASFSAFNTFREVDRFAELLETLTRKGAD